MRKRTSLAFVFAAVLSACAGGGDDPPTPDAQANPNIPVCGDGTCAGTEVGVCSQDCGSSSAQCGNSQCENGETNVNCPSDCATGPVCGDAQCDMAGGENSTNCPGDCGGSQGGTCPADPTECFICILGLGCPAGLDEASCTECIGGGGGGLSFCEGMAPDGVCNAGAGEDATTCPEDCP